MITQASNTSKAWKQLQKELLRVMYWLFLSIQFSLFTGAEEFNLNGGGGSFPAETYKVWMPSFIAYRKPFKAIHIHYNFSSSADGIWKITTGHEEDFHFAGTDMEIDEKLYEEYPDLQMFPTIAGAVVLGYNLPGIPKLLLKREHLVGIYNGSISMWNDTRLQEVNPDYALPDESILVVARSDSNALTKMYTNALSEFSEYWNETYGTFDAGSSQGYGKPMQWPPGVVKYFGKRPAGVIGIVLSTPYSIGYMSSADSDAHKIPTAYIQNSNGMYSSPSTDHIHDAMDYFVGSLDTPRMTARISNAGGEESYPIAGYSYFLIHLSTMKDCEAAVELYRYIEWFLTDIQAQEDCEAHNMVHLSEKVVDIIRHRVLYRMYCKGQSVRVLVEKEEKKELHSLQIWRLPVYVSSPILVLIFLGFMVYVIIQHIKSNRAIWNKDWLIPITAIRLRTYSLSSRSKISLSRSIRSGSTTGNTWAKQTWKFGIWKDATVQMVPVGLKGSTHLTKKAQRRLLHFQESMIHINVNSFLGLTLFENQLYYVNDYCGKGVLRDVLQNGNLKLDDNFKFSMALDLAQGMLYLHNHDIIHGKLSSLTCLIDGRWTAKICGWEEWSFCKVQPNFDFQAGQHCDDVEAISDKDVLARDLFWTAPEILINSETECTKESDIYSFAIIVLELVTREDPFYEQVELGTSPSEIIEDVKNIGLRPQLPKDMPPKIKDLVTNLWSPDPKHRAHFPVILKKLKAAKPTKKSVLDCMMEAVEEYMNTLEEKIQERTAELAIAMNNMESLLHKMLPPTVADKLSQGQTIEPEAFESVSIFFSDIVGFTTLSATSSPIQIVDMLNALYTSFDEILSRHDVYKVETIGDAYMVISGLPKRNGNEHARHIANMTLELAQAASKFVIVHRPNERLNLRCGMHTGPVVAGVVGRKMPRYTLFGDTVNTASRMESTSVAMKIQVSEPTHFLLETMGGYVMVYRGEIEVKGKGKMKTYWLHGREGMEDETPEEFRRFIK